MCADPTPDQEHSAAQGAEHCGPYRLPSYPSLKTARANFTSVQQIHDGPLPCNFRGMVLQLQWPYGCLPHAPVFRRQYMYCLNRYGTLMHLAHLCVDDHLQAGWVEGGRTGVVGKHVKGVHAAGGTRIPQRRPVQQQLSCGAEAQALRVTRAPAWTACRRCLRRCRLLATEQTVSGLQCTQLNAVLNLIAAMSAVCTLTAVYCRPCNASQHATGCTA